jgi:hypothetical protein
VLENEESMMTWDSSRTLSPQSLIVWIQSVNPQVKPQHI